MRDRLKDWGLSVATPVTDAMVMQEGEAVFSLPESAEQDAVSALVSLGYSQLQASKAVQKIKRPDMNSEQLIKDALRSMI
jgi:Holliday junction DNA helicase RuvA